MISSSRDQQVYTVLLNRPDKRNALTPDMFSGLREALAPAAIGDARALLLTGEGPIFCGGFDLQLCQREQGPLATLLNGLYDTIARLRSLPIPVVIGAQGAAIAGGCALLGGADVVVTDREAKLGYPVTPLGISPAISAPFLRHSIGDGPCRARLLHPVLFSGTEALRLGLVHELVDEPSQVRSRGTELAASLAAKPSAAIEATRRWLAEVEDLLDLVPARRGLEASLALVGGEEERRRLAELFA